MALSQVPEQWHIGFCGFCGVRGGGTKNVKLLTFMMFCDMYTLSSTRAGSIAKICHRYMYVQETRCTFLLLLSTACSILCIIKWIGYPTIICYSTLVNQGGEGGLCLEFKLSSEHLQGSGVPKQCGSKGGIVIFTTLHSTAPPLPVSLKNSAVHVRQNSIIYTVCISLVQLSDALKQCIDVTNIFIL